MDPVNTKIWETFHIKRGDNLPYTGWAGTREVMAKMFGELGFKRGAEIGVERGLFSALLCQSIPGLKLLCIDPWAPYGRNNSAREEHLYQRARNILSGFPGAEIIRKTSVEAAKDVADGSLDFVYIDGLHDFDSVIADILQWVPKVRLGGIVSGHDFFFSYGQGVIQAVTAYTNAHNIQMWYLTALDQHPSWLWVR